MRRLYDKNEVTFAVLWIVFYCVLMANMQGAYGYEGFPTFAALAAIAATIFFFVKHEHLEARYGLDHWPKDTKRYLYLIPMWIAATGNLWSGFGMEYQGIQQLLATLSMALVGFIEEMLFRGFLFRGMLKDGKTLNAIIISSLTFGIGHIVNLFAGHASFETFVQIFFAISWGFIFTMVYYRCGSILPCILAHSMIDVFSLYNKESLLMDWVYIISTIVIAILYCTYLYRIGNKEKV